MAVAADALRRYTLVVDTNVVVAGLLTRSEAAPTRRLLDAMLAGECRFVLSTELVAEYRLVLRRPKIARAHGLTEEDVDEVLLRLATNGVVVELPLRDDDTVPDLAGDEHVVALLEAASGSVLVTGDLELLRRVGARGLRPRDLFERR